MVPGVSKVCPYPYSRKGVKGTEPCPSLRFSGPETFHLRTEIIRMQGQRLTYSLKGAASGNNSDDDDLRLIITVMLMVMAVMMCVMVMVMTM